MGKQDLFGQLQKAFRAAQEKKKAYDEAAVKADEALSAYNEASQKFGAIQGELQKSLGEILPNLSGRIQRSA